MKNKIKFQVIIAFLIVLLIVSCKKSNEESILPTSPVETADSGSTTVTITNTDTTIAGNSTVVLSNSCSSAKLVYGVIKGKVSGNIVTAETLLYGAGTPIAASINGTTMFSKTGNASFTGVFIGVIVNGKLYASGGMPLDEYNADRNAVLTYWDNITITAAEQKANMSNLPNSMMAKAEMQTSLGSGKFEIYINPKIKDAKFLNSVFIVNSTGGQYSGSIFTDTGEAGTYTGFIRGGMLQGKTWGKLCLQITSDGTGYALDSSGNFFGKGNVALNGVAKTVNNVFSNTWTNVYGRFESCNDNSAFGSIQGSLSDDAVITITQSNGQTQSVTTSQSNPGFVFNNVPPGETTIVFNTNGQTVTQSVQVVAGQITQINPFGSTQELLNSLKGQVYEIVNNGSATTVENITDTAIGNAFYTREINVPVRNFEDGFPGITNRYEWFGIRYAGKITAPVTGKYIFKITSDDGAVLYIDNQPVVNNDNVHAPKSTTGEIELIAGQTYNINVKYFQGPKYQIALILEAQLPGSSMKLFNMADFAR